MSKVRAKQGKAKQRKAKQSSSQLKDETSGFGLATGPILDPGRQWLPSGVVYT